MKSFRGIFFLSDLERHNPCKPGCVCAGAERGAEGGGAGRCVGAGVDGEQDGDHYGAERGVGGERHHDRHISGELPRGRKHRAPGAALGDRVRGQDGVRAVRAAAPALLPDEDGWGGFRGGEALHDGRLPEDDVAAD